MSTGYLPKNVQYMLNRLSNYSRQTYRLQAQNADVAVAGGFITCSLPTNALVDLSTFTMHFKGSATAASTFFAKFPRNIETTIDSLSVSANGQLLSSIPMNYSQLFQIMADTTLGTDATIRRGILQNSADITTPATGAGNNDSVARWYAISNWLGLLGSIQPQVIETGALGNLDVRIGLASPSILVGSSGATGLAFSFSDVYFTVDCLAMDESVHGAYASYLNQGGVLEAAYDDIYCFSQGPFQSGNGSGNVRFAVSSQSIDMVLATFVETATPNTLETKTKTSNYFTRRGAPASGTELQWNFNVGNTYFPNFKLNSDNAFQMLVHALGTAQDTLGGMHPALNSLDQWRTAFWVAAYRFSHNGDDSSREISGIDGRGNVVQNFFEFQNLDVTTAKTCLIFVICKAVLQIGAGRLLTKIS